MQHNRYKTQYSNNYQLKSFQQSPIHAPSQLDSDRSPQPFLYPTSLQPKKYHKIPQFINLKVQVINLLTKLKEWLVQLCLTQNCTGEVNQQLEPIIDEIKQIGVQQNESYWMQTLNYRNSNHSIKQSTVNVFVNSVMSQNMQYCSVLMNDSKAEVAVLGENQKTLVKLYFKRYYRLLENCLARINRCSGEKKLKFLVQTTVKNIFSQTMRVSYDLKLVQHRIKEQKVYKMSINRNAYIRVMADRIRMILYDRGNLSQAFARLKQDYIQGLKRDGIFVERMLKNMDKLCAIYQRNRRWALTKKFYNWRQSSIHQKFNQQLIIIDSIRSALVNIVPHMMPDCSREEFTINWRNSIEININSILDSIFSGQNCIFISLMDILKQPRLQKNLSFIQFLEEQQQLGGVTHRSGICREHPFLSEFTCDELKNCILSGEIYRSDRQGSSLLLIPIKPSPGIIFVALATQPFTVLSFSKRPLSVNSFRILLRIVEILTPLLEQIAQKCKRIQQQWQQIDRQSHYQMFFREFIKTELICSGGSTQNHLQVNQRGNEEFQIDSHRLEYPNTIISSFIQKFQITNLMIYHINPQNTIKQMPCVILGDDELAKMQKYIVNSIYLQLINSGKQFLMITRNNKSFCVLPLKKQNQVIGFIHYISKNDQRIEHVAITECLVPLVLRYEGAMNCQKCSIKLALPPSQVQPNKQQKYLQMNRYKLEYNDASRLVVANDLFQLQQIISAVLKSEEYIFQKMIYKINLADPTLYYYINQHNNTPNLEFFNLKQTEKITHSDIIIQENGNIKDSGFFGKFVSRFPNFSNLHLHLYQYENNHVFRVVALPIKKDNIVFGYLLIGHFLRENKWNDGMLQWLKKLVDCIAMNRMFRAVNLQNESLSMELNAESEERVQLVDKISDRLSRWSGRGKFYQQINSFTNDLLEQNKSTAKFTILKLNTKQKIMTKIIIPTDDSTPSKEFTINENTLHLISKSEIMPSHQKLISQTCKLTKNNPNRTIRPLKMQKLYQTNVFVADLPQQMRRVLINKIKEVFQLQGWMSTEYLSSIRQITSNLNCNKNKSDNFDVLVNLGLNRAQEMYFLLIEGDESELNQWIFMNSTLLNNIKYKYAQIIAECNLNKPTPQTKRQTISKLNQIVCQMNSPRLFIRRWKQNYTQTKHKVQRMQLILQRIIMPQLSRNRSYLSMLDNAMIKIKSQVYHLLQKYRIFTIRILLLLDHADRRISLFQGFKSIFESIQQPCNFSEYRGSVKMQAKLHKLMKKIMIQPFSQLIWYSQFIRNQTETKQKLSAIRLTQIFNFIEYRQNKRHFLNQIRKMQKSFEQNLSLISFQYKNMTFYSRQAFLHSINQRFNTIIQQINYSHIAKIDLYSVQREQNVYIFYKICKQKGFIQRNEVINNDFLSQNGIVELPVPCSFGENHFIFYKIVTKTEIKPQKEMNVVRDIIEKGIIPCYSRYLNASLEKAQQMCKILTKVYSRETFNGSSSDAQKLYIFGRGLCAEQQSFKLKVISSLRSMKTIQKIEQTKQMKKEINQQSKYLYNLQYQHNALSGLLSGNIKQLDEQQNKALDKYGQVVTRNNLKEMRQSLQILQTQEQKKLLQYQIKSKTFATSKIITIFEKRQNAEVERVSYQYLIKNKENIVLGLNHKNIEKVYVQKKLELNRVKDMIKQQIKKQKKSAARAIWLVCNQLIRNQVNKNVQSSFNTICVPRRINLRRLM